MITQEVLGPRRAILTSGITRDRFTIAVETEGDMDRALTALIDELTHIQLKRIEKEAATCRAAS